MIKALWSAEAIGGMSDSVRRPWVAEITGLSARYGLQREFLKARVDYTGANSRGTRGVKCWWTLEHGRYYQVRLFYSWGDEERCFVTVDADGDVIEVEQEEVERWIRDRLGVDSASTS
ncbi:hypothetical protein [Marinactinospora rubrisoli]|uniref:Uncharacterized protein n=1 Tax=Marinactinospora rubrisoli TaxID=2715399 RepID=A0ABW2KPZ8_9ACTN